jgi:hypothetical protein
MTMRKFLALAFVLLAVPALAQTPVSGHISSDTAGSVAMIVKYIGTGSNATVAVDAATGDIEFKVAAAADNLNIDTGSVCAGGVAASLDVSDAQCDTFGEVVDLINASTHWRAVLVGALRTDTTNNTLTTIGATQATRADGLALYFDSAVSLTTTVALVPPGCLTDIRCYMTPSGKLLENPFGNQQIDVRWVEGFATYATTGEFEIYSVKPSNKASGSENVMTLHQEVSGASGTNKQLTQFQYYGVLGRPHDKVLVRITTTGASSAYNLHAYGFIRPVSGP